MSDILPEDGTAGTVVGRGAWSPCLEVGIGTPDGTVLMRNLVGQGLLK